MYEVGNELTNHERHNLTLHDITCDDTYRSVLSALLRDRSTPNSTKSIIWATAAYANHGVGYAGSDQMTVDTVRHLVSMGELIPRCEKDAATQQRRTADKAEVFTPSWLCNSMINGVEECLFEGRHPFNDETDETGGKRGWKTKTAPIFGKTSDEKGGKNDDGDGSDSADWHEYVSKLCLEITCGEAPYLTSRYDTVTNKPIDIEDRIGFFDRKIRVIMENAGSTAERRHAIDKALSSIYGFEYQGDNLFLARMNMLLTWHEAVVIIDESHNRFDDGWDDIDDMVEAANTISKNIVQMDGITLTVPQREQGGEEPTVETGGSLFGLTGGEMNGNCADSMDNGNADMPVYACIYNRNKRVTFHDLIDGRGRRHMAFDFVIGNPPYHKDGGGAERRFPSMGSSWRTSSIQR